MSRLTAGLLLIEGQAGAGKTTFLRLASSLLGRDALGLPSPDGAPWRKRLGYENESPLLTPVFVRASELGSALEKLPTGRQDDRYLLGELLHETCSNGECALSGAEWTGLLDRGEAILLLDGVDEVADGALRTRLFSMLRDASRRAKSPIVVTSRPIDTRELVNKVSCRRRSSPSGRAKSRRSSGAGCGRCTRWGKARRLRAKPSAIGPS